MTTEDRARELLSASLGEEAEFHPGQLEAIQALVEDHSRVLVVQRTGWGKSVVYFVATKLLREQRLGPTILISPLLSLMRDQVRMATSLGLRAVRLDSTNVAEWEKIEEALVKDEIDLLMVSPERLANPRFQDKTLGAIPRGIGLFVVDEAHCISDWGHDFRPDYRRIRRITAALPEGVPLLATTATANDRVVADVEEQLGPGLRVIRGSLERESLFLQTVELADQAERLAWLVEYLRGVEGSGVIYTLTVADAERVSAWLAENGIDAPSYSGRLEGEQRVELERRLRRNELKALVSTVALGMGFDKPDLAFVVHYQRPSSVIAYYQQIGRAGRAVARAEVVLLAGREDDEIAEYFIGGAFPPEDALLAVLETVAEADGISVRELETLVNLKHSVIEAALKILEVDGAVARDPARTSKWIRTPNPWDYDAARIDAVTAERRDELEQMRLYVGTDECLMSFLTSQLDDPGAAACGRCANCAGEFASLEIDDSLVTDAGRFLRRLYRPIEPRKQWPTGLEARGGRIPEEHRLREGRALAVYGDAGWGRLVRAGKYGEDGFDDELVDAMVEMIENDLAVDSAPTWVTSVPSLRHPELVPRFARKLAEALGLEYREALVKIRDVPPQKTMENSAQQALNAIGAFDVVEDAVIGEPVLLVDDMVDSGWSLTVCGVALAEAGAGAVYPVVLGETSSRSS